MVWRLAEGCRRLDVVNRAQIHWVFSVQCILVEWMAKKTLIMSSFDNLNPWRRFRMSLKYRYIDIYFNVLRTKDQNFIFIFIMLLICNATQSLSFQTQIAFNITMKSQVFWHCYITDNKDGCMTFWKEVWQPFKSQVSSQQQTKQPSSGNIFFPFFCSHSDCYSKREWLNLCKHNIKVLSL